MPLTDGLGKAVLARLNHFGRSSIRPYTGARFEAWLSRLAEPQPDLSAAENLENRGLFHRISEALREEVIDAELRVLSEPTPWWLRRLVGAWHFSGASTIITFNYDLLVEHALESSGLADERGNRITTESILGFGPKLPSINSMGLVLHRKPARSFELLKLHGSVDAFWVQDDSTGVSISRWPSRSSWGNPAKPSEDARRQALPDRAPFIVPPAAAKSSFYANPVTRELWQQAGAALTNADDVALVGYSLPPTDLVTVGMLTDRLLGKSSQVLIVNPDSTSVSTTLQSLGVEQNRIHSMKSVEDYATHVERRLSPLWHRPEIVRQSPLVVDPFRRGSRLDVTKIIGVEPDNTVILEVAPQGECASGPIVVSQVWEAAQSDTPRSRIKWPNGLESYVGRTESGDAGADLTSLTLVATAVPQGPA